MRLIPIFALFLASCSKNNIVDNPIRDRLSDYKNVAIGNKISVPSEFASENIKELVPIPINKGEQLNVFEDEEFLLKPEVSELENLFSSEVLIYKSSDNNIWASFPFPPSIVWPAIEQFMANNKIQIAKIERTETMWRLKTSVIKGSNEYSGSKILRYLNPNIGA